MHTQITARHFDATPELREYVATRLAKLSRFYDGITDAHVVLSEQRQPATEKTAEVSLHVFRQRLIAQDSGNTHEEALDRCTDHLRRQILRYKAKLRSKKKNVHH